MSPKSSPVMVNSGEMLIKEILRPLCDLIRSGRQGDNLRLQMNAQNIVTILNSLGYQREAVQVEKSSV